MATSNPGTGDTKIEVPMKARLVHPHSTFHVNQDYIVKTVKKKNKTVELERWFGS